MVEEIYISDDKELVQRQMMEGSNANSRLVMKSLAVIDYMKVTVLFVIGLILCKSLAFMMAQIFVQAGEV